MFVQGLKQIKDFLDEDIFTKEEFDHQKFALMTLYPVARSGPLSGVAGHSVPHSPESQPLKGLCDQRVRDPRTGHYLGGLRKCCKCPLLECFWTLSQFSPDIQREGRASVRLCVLHEGQPVTPISYTTPTHRVRRKLLSPVTLHNLTLRFPLKQDQYHTLICKVSELCCCWTDCLSC